MKKLFAQIVKFGIVGFISFGIDYVTGLIVLNLVMALTSSSYFEMASLVGSVAGFTVSVIATAAVHRLQPDLHHCKSLCNCGCHGVQLYYQKNLSGEEMILKKI